MRRSIAILVIAIIGVGLGTWLMQTQEEGGKVTMEEIQARIKHEKAELKAELAQAGRPYEPGQFPNQWDMPSGHIPNTAPTTISSQKPW